MGFLQAIARKPLGIKARQPSQIEPYVSVLMLTHNAPEYVEKSIRSLAEKTKNVAYELIVVDNASDEPTRALVKKLKDEGLISKLVLLDRNSLFAEGNNIASTHASERATHFLLLNSDVEIRSEQWLKHLLAIHRRGVTSYGISAVSEQVKVVDGYCFLIDADIYRRHRLDQAHQWWFAVTKIQAKILNEGLSVQGYKNHETYLHHFGGKSGKGYVGAKGMDVTVEEVGRWFAGRAIKLLT